MYLNTKIHFVTDFKAQYRHHTRGNQEKTLSSRLRCLSRYLSFRAWVTCANAMKMNLPCAQSHIITCRSRCFTGLSIPNSDTDLWNCIYWYNKTDLTNPSNELWNHCCYFEDNIWWSGGRLNIKLSSYQYRDPHVDDTTVRHRLIFNMGIPISGKDCLYIETGPWSCWMILLSDMRTGAVGQGF